MIRRNFLLSLVLLTFLTEIHYAKVAPAKRTSQGDNQSSEISELEEKKSAAPEPAEQSSSYQQPNEDAELQKKLQEQRKLEVEITLIRTQLERELIQLRTEIERMRVQKEVELLKWELDQEKNVKKHEQEMIALNQQRDKIAAEVALAQAQLAQSMEKFNATYTEMQNQSLLLKTSADQLRAEIDRKKARKERSDFADGHPEYLQNPLLKDGTLVLSDRCVHLNGVITPWKANRIADQIHYFNNKEKNHPIFLIIENSPGGSVMAGFHILQAMQNSQAPVYVIVKTFAASMAAGLTTLATKSFAYPNATILHHLPWTLLGGNLRELKEEVDFMKEIWKRLGGPISKKMGISLDKLEQLLYEKASNGDWTEFADNAQKIKWVDHIITNIKDTRLQEAPQEMNYSFERYVKDYYDLADPTSGTIMLPALGPKDFYYLYNPDNRYQLAKNKAQLTLVYYTSTSPFLSTNSLLVITPPFFN
eukprot:gene290-379_t